MKLPGRASWLPPATAILLLVLAISGAASADPDSCVSPGVGRILQGMVEAHAFAGVVPSGYKLERLDVNKDHLEMGYDDDAGPAVTVMLTKPTKGNAATPADAHGPHFEHRIVDVRGHAPGPARDAMLRAAMLVDKALSAEDLAACADDTPVLKPSKRLVGIGAEAIAVLAAIAVLVAVAAWLGRRRGKAPGGEAQPPGTP